MLTDPLSVTYDGSAKSLPRVSGARPGIKKELSKTSYRTPNGEFGVYITQSLMADGVKRAEIILERVTLDPDGPFEGQYSPLPNRVGLVFEVNDLRFATSTDLSLIRSALDSLVDATLMDRLVGGES